MNIENEKIRLARGFAPTLFEKLFDDQPHVPTEYALRRLSMEELKESVAHDVEALLNSRCGLGLEALEAFIQCQRSMLSYGMTDFIGLSLANPADRDYICRAIERTIAAHEPRLCNVRVEIDVGHNSTSRLNFSITALLVVHPVQEPVNFDALLQPTIQQYSVSKARRPVPR